MTRGRIRGLACALLAGSASVAALAQSLADKADAYVKAAVEARQFSGTVALRAADGSLWIKGYGLADAERGVANVPGTRFRLASITKTFTATGILMLRERGKLSLEDPACGSLAECPAAWRAITIRHLLTHTSGIRDGASTREAVAAATPAQLLARAQAQPLAFTPGERGLYSNAGYVALGLVIEKLSGVSYAEFVRTQIFQPLGMTRSGYEGGDAVDGLAKGYQARDGKLVPAAMHDMSNAYSAGALYSTAEDMLRWDDALAAGRLLPRRAMDEMSTPFREVLPGISFGLGWGVTTIAGHAAVLHAGDVSGYSGAIARFPGDHAAIVVLGNNGSAEAMAMLPDLAAILFDRPYELPRVRRAVQLAEATLARYAGRYRMAASTLFPPDTVMTLTIEGGKLLRQVNGGTRVEWLPRSDVDFFQVAPEIEIRFVLGADGDVDGFVWRRGVMEVRATRMREGGK